MADRSYLRHMEFSGLGGGIMVALAAGLWLVYLMPSWFKRRDYVATERAEVRRQQALRVLQETTSVPVMQRVESIVTAAGEVRDREKLAEAIQRSKEAQAARAVTRVTRDAATSPAVRARAAGRLRRTRAVASLFLLAAIITAVVQVIVMATAGIAMGAWAVLGFAAVVGVVSVSALGRLSSISRRRAAAPVVRVAAPVRTRVENAPVEQEQAAPAQSWTPVPVPKPMYLSRTSIVPQAPVVDVVAQLRAAALEADRALRDAQESPEVTPITRSEPEAVPSRFASMGIIDTADVEGTDLDDILRRRRAV
jgi:hypothetical protein